MKKQIYSLLVLTTISLLNAQTSVNYNTTGWTDFGTISQTFVSGNFKPGWTVSTPSPDLSVGNVFNMPHQTLSGAPDDAGLWFNGRAKETVNFQSESAILSLSGFNLGQQYAIDFYSTLLYQPENNFHSQNGFIQVDITGANISLFTGSTMSDLIGGDGLNQWIGQQIIFTANASTVTFDFTGKPLINDQVARVGIDGFSAQSIPEPSTSVLVAFSFLGLISRRNRNNQ